MEAPTRPPLSGGLARRPSIWHALGRRGGLLGLRDWPGRLARRIDPSTHRPLLPERPDGLFWSRFVIPADLRARALDAELDDRGHGYDAFGMSRAGIAAGMAISHWMYTRYFRVISHGVEHVPDEGPVVLASNHSGMLPLDAFMIWADIVRNGTRVRIPRVVVDNFVPGLPWVNHVFTRAGAIGGSRGNFHAVLDAGGMILVFPEGEPGISKPFSQRYQLQHFREGHAELAIRHSAKIVPVAVVGAEEQWPQIATIKGIHLFGAPHLPVPATPLPLPVRYHLWYGPPIDVTEQAEPHQSTDAEIVGALALRVKAEVASLIERGLRERKGIFR